MKRKICIIIAVCFLLTTQSFAHEQNGSDLTNNDKLFIIQAEEFLSSISQDFEGDFILSGCREVWLGEEIPEYVGIGETNTYSPTEDSVYPISVGDKIIGLLHVHQLSLGCFAFSYSEGIVPYVGNSFERIAYLSNGYDSFFITEDDYYKQELLYINNPLFAAPIQKVICLQLDNLQNVCANRSIPSSYSLPVPNKAQTTNYSCWAASIASVASYKKSPLEYSCNDIITMTGITGMASMYQVRSALISLSLSVSPSYSSLSTSTLISNICANKPMLGGFIFDSSYGHMMVIRGYGSGVSYFKMALMDPNGGVKIAVDIITESNMSFYYNGHSWYLNEYVRVG